MPGRNGTGPWGRGPGSGWGRGPCRNHGAGFGRRSRAFDLKDELAYLKAEKTDIDARIKEIEQAKE